MAKIILNNKEYIIDDAILSLAKVELKSHLLSVMNGAGATIEFDGVSYNIDSTKLAAATNEFIAHLGTIAGSGKKVIINGVEHSIDVNKMAGAVSGLETVFGKLENGGEGDSKELNEYGFYYNVPYTFTQETAQMHAVLREDGSVEMYMTNAEEGLFGVPYTVLMSQDGVDVQISYTCNDGILNISAEGMTIPFSISDDGLSLIDTMGALTGVAGGAFTCTFEDCHDIYFETQYCCQGTAFPDMTFYADGSAISSNGTLDVPAGTITYSSHKINVMGTYAYVSMDGRTLWVDGEPMFSAVAGHTCNYSAQNTSSKYLAAEATCTSPARYYYSCPVCGKSGTETFEYGDLIAHNYVNKICTVCGDIHDCDYTRQHTGVQYLAAAATCTSPALYYYSCEHGVKDTKTFEYGKRDEHTYKNTICTVCGSKQAGLYETDSNYIVLLTSWDELVENDLFYCSETLGSYRCYCSGSLEQKSLIAGDLVLPEYVEDFCNTGFSNCTSLTGVMLPKSMTGIDYAAFRECTSLKSINIPSNVTYIGNEAFLRCRSLTSIVIPASVTSIGEWAFNSCTGLTSVKIGNGITSIGERAFFHCTGLVDITFNGTTSEWNAITKGDDWNYNVPATYVQCTDGRVTL